MSNTKLSSRQVTFWTAINQSLTSSNVEKLIESYKADVQGTSNDEKSIELKYALISKIIEIVKNSLDQELEGGLNEHEKSLMRQSELF
jgi:hypothetical protein